MSKPGTLFVQDEATGEYRRARPKEIVAPGRRQNRLECGLGVLRTGFDRSFNAVNHLGGCAQGAAGHLVQHGLILLMANAGQHRHGTHAHRPRQGFLVDTTWKVSG